MKAQVATSGWSFNLVEDIKAGSCVTVGLISGSRAPNDRRTVDKLVADAACQLEQFDVERRVLALRLDVHLSRDLDRGVDQPDRIPMAQRSPLGPWAEVTVPMPVGSMASWSLQQVPRWLSAWKASFGVILIDLGPIHLVPSRTIGRLCDGSYLLLGPGACASQEWITQHLAWHSRSGSTICGSIVTTVAKAA